MAARFQWRAVFWPFSAVGRARLTLSRKRSDSARLRAALTVVQQSPRASTVAVAGLIHALLARLVELAIAATDFPSASSDLAQLDRTGAPAGVRLPLRWHLIQRLLTSGEPMRARAESLLYVGEAASPAEHVAELLRWSLRQQVVDLDDCVHADARADPLVATLLLCRSVPQVPAEALGVAAAIHSDLLRDWPDLHCRAEVVRAQCFSLTGRWAEMLSATRAAVAARPIEPEARYWHLRALLHAASIPDAVAELARGERGPTPAWDRIAAIVDLAARPSLERAAAVIDAIERHGWSLDQSERSLALAALQPALLASVEDSHERLRAIASLTRRIQTNGRAPDWAEFTLAVEAICVDGNFPAGRERLERAVAPAGECPVWILRAVCALVLGHEEDWTRALLETAPLDTYVEDARYLRALAEALRFDAEAPAPGSAILTHLATDSCRLPRTIPALAAIGSLVRDVHRWLKQADGDLENSPRPELAICAWASWLAIRLDAARNGQSLHAAGDTGPATAEVSASPIGALVQCDATTAHDYGRGRDLLRRGQPREALVSFADARARCAGHHPGAILVRARFAPLLTYWEGVALAHQRQYAEADEKLLELSGSIWGMDASAQRGLIAVARGDWPAARRFVDEIPEPWSAAALYLASLTALQDGRRDRAQTLATAIGQLPAAAGSAYRVAALRVLGAIEEIEHHPDAASEHYRRALAAQPADPAAAARLGRVWSRQAYDQLRDGGPVPREPSLGGLWDALDAVPWGSQLRDLREWLCAGAREIPPPDGPVSPSLRRAALAILLHLEQFSDAARRSEAWNVEGPEAPRFTAVSAILRGVANVKASASRDVAAAWTADLAACQHAIPHDAELTFWHAVAACVGDPESTAAAEQIATVAADPRLREDRRAFAALTALLTGRAPAQPGDSPGAGRLTPDADGDTRQRAIACLLAYVDANDAAFLERYRAVERDLSSLPCDPADLYAAVVDARLRMGDAESVLQGHIPDEVADLSDPRVRHVLGLAYAHRAVHHAEHDVRSALDDLEQALAMLGD